MADLAADCPGHLRDAWLLGCAHAGEQVAHSPIPGSGCYHRKARGDGDEPKEARGPKQSKEEYAGEGEVDHSRCTGSRNHDSAAVAVTRMWRGLYVTPGRLDYSLHDFLVAVDGTYTYVDEPYD